MATFTEIARSRNILLTTFTKDGRPKPTVIWAAPDQDRLLVITEADSWKVKRIRKNPHVTVAASDRRGRPRSSPIDATALILGPADTAQVYAAVARQYGPLGGLFQFFSKLRGGMRRNVGIALVPYDSSADTTC
jgi:PPOX class probable F420-dependent enzyme